MLTIGHNLGGALVLDEVFPQVLDSLFRIFVQAERGFIALLGPDGTLVPRWSQVLSTNSSEPIRANRAIANMVMENQEGILSASEMKDEEIEKAHSVADLNIRYIMCAP